MKKGKALERCAAIKKREEGDIALPGFFPVLKMILFNSVFERMSVFLPHDRKFFELFEALADKAVEASQLLVDLGADYTNLSGISEKLKVLEEEADSVVHQIIHELYYDHTRVTEEKGDIRYFAHNLDNIIDGVEKAVARLAFTPRPALPEPVSEFSPIILEASLEIKKAISCLRDMKCEDGSLETGCIRINELENEADKINRKWLKMLMTTPVKKTEELLERQVLKEIVDILEDTMDQCEDVANILETFRLKGGV